MVKERERNIKDQIIALSPTERWCLDQLKAKWQRRNPYEPPLTEDMYLRYSRCSPGEAFNERSAWKVLKRYDHQCHKRLSVAVLERQLASKTVFPVPSLRTQAGHEVVYMRPSRHAAKATSSREVLESVAYTISTMMEREELCKRGIAFLVNMDDFTMSNFSTQYWQKLMLILQGQTVPVRVSMFLIVNPPAWFGTIWSIMKPMLSSDFQERVKMIQEPALISEYLAWGHDEFLPNDMTRGQASTEEMVRDFIERRKLVEAVPRSHTLSALGVKRRSRLDLSKQQSRRKLDRMPRQKSVKNFVSEQLDLSPRLRRQQSYSVLNCCEDTTPDSSPLPLTPRKLRRPTLARQKSYSFLENDEDKSETRRSLSFSPRKLGRPTISKQQSCSVLQLNKCLTVTPALGCT